jgi:hypothetical protein
VTTTDALTKPGDAVAALTSRDLDGDRLGCRAE